MKMTCQPNFNRQMVVSTGPACAFSSSAKMLSLRKLGTLTITRPNGGHLFVPKALGIRTSPVVECQATKSDESVMPASSRLGSAMTTTAITASLLAASALPAGATVLDASTVHLLGDILRPTFLIFTCLYIVRIPMTWYPNIDGKEFPWCDSQPAFVSSLSSCMAAWRGMHALHLGTSSHSLTDILACTAATLPHCVHYPGARPPLRLGRQSDTFSRFCTLTQQCCHFVPPGQLHTHPPSPFWQQHAR